jgi:hypothetical protein
MTWDLETSGLRGAVVLGMDRSGSSVTTRMLHQSGFFIGRAVDVLQADLSNPTGYFENTRALATNEEVLSDLGYSLRSPDGLERLTPSAELACRLQDVLANLLAAAETAPLALKDPRISMLIRAWRPLLDGVLHPVLVVRHPGEVACSLRRRDGTPLSVGLALWEHRLSMLLNSLGDADVSVVPYSRVLGEPRLAGAIVSEISDLLQPALRTVVDTTRAASAFDPHVRRTRIASDGTWKLTETQQRLWRFLDSLGVGLTKLEEPGWARNGSPLRPGRQ